MSPLLVLIAASLLWGLTWWPLKQLHGLGIEGIPLIFVGYGAVALSTLPFLWKTRLVWWPHVRMMMAIAFLGGIANLSFASALVYGEVVRAMVLFYLLPLWGVLGGRVFLGERIGPLRAAAMVLALAGALLVLGGPAMFSSPPGFIDLVAVLAGFALAINNICFRASQALPVANKVSAMFVGCACVAGVLILMGVQSMPQLEDAASWGFVVAFGFGILMATAGTQYGVTHMEAGRSSIIMILELLCAAFSAAILGQQELAAVELLGGLLIITASLLEARSGATPVPPALPETP